MENEDTTIRIKENTKDRIEKEKIHPNQSFDEILNQILDKYEEIKKQ